MPEGFPGPGPLGEAVLKEYPAYRAARTPGGMGAFWRLFAHIKRERIEMTAPVEMTMEGARTIDMAFLYRSTALGRVGTEAAVEVLDLPAARVISFGIRGTPTPERIEDAKRAIERRRIGDGLEAAGPHRLLGYNSPMVPSDDRFFELQLPVRRPAAGSPTQEAGPVPR